MHAVLSDITDNLHDSANSPNPALNASNSIASTNNVPSTPDHGPLDTPAGPAMDGDALASSTSDTPAGPAMDGNTLASSASSAPDHGPSDTPAASGMPWTAMRWLVLALVPTQPEMR